MASSKAVKVATSIVGACFVLMGLVCLWVWSIGDFSSGRTATFAMGAGCLVIALPFFAYRYSPRLAKVLAVVMLLAFAASMVWLTFQPNTPAPNATIYRIAAIAMCVLLAARRFLRRPWRLVRGRKDSL